MITTEELIEIIDNTEHKGIYKLATVTELFPGGAPKLKFDGEEITSGKEYKRLSSYSPLKDDRVLLLKTRRTYVILGKLI